MDKAIGLIRLAPLIHGIDNWASGYVREVLLSSLERLKTDDDVIESRTDEAFRYLVEHRSDMTDEFGGHFPDDRALEMDQETALDRVWKLLMHPTIVQVEDGGLAEMRSAVAIMRNSSDDGELTDAAYSFVEACYEFGEHFYRRLPDHLLGEWGGELFRYMLMSDEPQDLRILARSYGGDIPTKDLSVDHGVKLDAGTFTVQMGARPPCFLGNGRQYALLTHLIERPRRYVSFADLASVVGGDELDREAVIVTKCRLSRKLEKSGYGDLAKMIRAQPDHYAFWPS